METYSSLNKAGRDVTYSPEHKRRGQLGDAPGFGEMQGIFAEAYQMVLGRSPANMKKGQEAIEEMNKAMEKGQVIPAKILPLVAQIAKRMAEPGLAEARTASFAEQNRFFNQMTDGWKLFREGGGEEGDAHFWIMMQDFGQWWKDNGTQLGMYFKSAILYLDAFQESIKELFHFAKTGENNSISERLAKYGIDLVAIRDEVLKSFTLLGDIFTEVAKITGFEQNGSLKQGLSNKISTFTKNLTAILNSVNEMLKHLSNAVGYYRQWQGLSFGQKSIVMVPGTTSNKIFAEGSAELLRGLGSLGEASIDAGIALGNLAIGSDSTAAQQARINSLVNQIPRGSADADQGKTTHISPPPAQGPYQPPTPNNYPPIPTPSLQGNIPSMSPVNSASITGGTRRADFVTHEDIIRGIFGGTRDAASAPKGLALGSGPGGTFQPPTQNNYILITLPPVQGLYQPPVQNNYIPISLPPLQGNIPSLGPIDPGTITGGTRANNFTTHKVDVTLKVEGNQEAIGLLIDSKVREGFPLMLTNEITKSMTAAPIRV